MLQSKRSKKYLVGAHVWHRINVLIKLYEKLLLVSLLFLDLLLECYVLLLKLDQLLVRRLLGILGNELLVLSIYFVELSLQEQESI